MCERHCPGQDPLSKVGGGRVPSIEGESARKPKGEKGREKGGDGDETNKPGGMFAMSFRLHEGE